MTSLLAAGLTSCVTFGELAVPEEDEVEEEETEEEEDWEQEGRSRRRVSPSLTGKNGKNVGEGKTNHQTTKPPNQTTKEKRNSFSFHH